MENMVLIVFFKKVLWNIKTVLEDITTENAPLKSHIDNGDESIQIASPRKTSNVQMKWTIRSSNVPMQSGCRYQNGN
jgi:hypothetical protein